MTPSRTWYNAASVLDHHGGDGIVGSFKLKTLAVSCSVPEPVT